MADHSIRFSFVKLQVEDMAGALAFWGVDQFEPIETKENRP